MGAGVNAERRLVHEKRSSVSLEAVVWNEHLLDRDSGGLGVVDSRLVNAWTV